ncbi:MAG: PilN domain-containing protein [Planctomycetes bacterium]|nr:PilN domain-containing protein [Planctomycetota bacterium]
MNAAAGDYVATVPGRDTLGQLPRVNLLPESERLRQTARRRQRVWGGLVVLVALLAGATWQWSRHCGSETTYVRTALADMRQRVRAAEKEAAALAAQTEVLHKQQASLDAMRATESWSQRLAELAAAVPEGAMLTLIRSGQATRTIGPSKGGRPAAPALSAAATPEMQVEGLALSHEALATLLTRLQQTGTYQTVRLVRSISEPIGSLTALDFGIVCRR